MAIFASGTGTNAQEIINRFKNHPLITVSLIVCNKKGAGVTGIGVAENIPVLLIEKEAFFNSDRYLVELKAKNIECIVLAGFLWKLPGSLVAAYPGQILNIHPALLPKHGGKGMWGNHVHQAVLDAGDTESGITIHYVDEHYDNGAIIFQARCPVLQGDTAEVLAKRVHSLEHDHFPRVIEETLCDS